MFLFKASNNIEEREKHLPDIHEACKLSMKDPSRDNDFMRGHQLAFGVCLRESIDYAVMEKTDHPVVAPIYAGWSDIASWSSLWNICVNDGNGNATYGDVMLHESQNSFSRTYGKLAPAIGVDGSMIVSTKDVLVVSHKDSAHDVNVIAKQLNADLRTAWKHHIDVHRSWGKYDSIVSGEQY